MYQTELNAAQNDWSKKGKMRRKGGKKERRKKWKKNERNKGQNEVWLETGTIFVILDFENADKLKKPPRPKLDLGNSYIALCRSFESKQIRTLIGP